MRLAFIWIAVISALATLGASQVQPQQRPELDASRQRDNSPKEVSEIFANGIVEGRSREIPLRFEVTGRLVSVVEEGAPVSAGDLLARIDPAVWEYELAEVEANLQLAKEERQRLLNGARQEARDIAAAQVQAAAVQAERARKTHARVVRLPAHAITRQELDDRTSDLALGKAELEIAKGRRREVNAPPREDELRIAAAKIDVARARVLHAKAMLAKSELRAPCDGVILQVRGEPGQMVGPDGDDPIVTMVDAGEVRVRAFVEEMDAARLVVGMTAAVTADGLDDVRFPASVVSCAPCMTRKTNIRNDPAERHDVRVREVVLRLDNPESQGRLVVGLPVDVFIACLGSFPPTSPSAILEARRAATLGGSTYTPAPSHAATGEQELE